MAIGSFMLKRDTDSSLLQYYQPVVGYLSLCCWWTLHSPVEIQKLGSKSWALFQYKKNIPPSIGIHIVKISWVLPVRYTWGMGKIYWYKTRAQESITIVGVYCIPVLHHYFLTLSSPFAINLRQDILLYIWSILIRFNVIVLHIFSCII